LSTARLSLSTAKFCCPQLRLKSDQLSWFSSYIINPSQKTLVVRFPNIIYTKLGKIKQINV